MRRQSLLLWGVVSVYCSLQNEFSMAQLGALFAFVTATPSRHVAGKTLLRSLKRAFVPAMSLRETGE
jgi:hypothetical protein